MDRLLPHELQPRNIQLYMLIGAYGKSSKAKEYLWDSGVGKFPEARRNYTTFEKQLLAYYWALIDMKQLTIDYPIIVRPQVPIMQWLLIQSSPRTHRIG